MLCPCGLTKSAVFDLCKRNVVPLIGGKCQIPIRHQDGTEGVCNYPLGAHPITQGIVVIPLPAKH